MLYSTASPDLLRRRRLLVAAIATVAGLVVIATYVALTHRATTATPSPEPLHAGTVVDAKPDDTANQITLPPLKATTDPERFARLVAQALFDWDTTAPIPLDDHTGQLVAVADPTRESSPGLVADIANYLPTPEAWQQLRPYSTRQWLTISTVEVPSLWPQAVAEAGPDGLLPGTTAYTITGVRHRAGVWEDEPVSTAHDVAFTVFIVCGPAYPECHLLRLSRLDEPLE